MNRLCISNALLVAIASLLLFAACSDDGPTGSSSPLIGTWIIMRQDGMNVSAYQWSYTFTDQCTNDQIGELFTGQYTLSETSLTLTFNGKTYVARRV